MTGLSNSSVYRWEKGGRALLSTMGFTQLPSMYFHPIFHSANIAWVWLNSPLHSVSLLNCHLLTIYESTSLLPGVFILLFSFYPLALHFIYDCLSALLECWPAPGARTLPVWGLALEWLCWEGTVPGMALPSVFSVTCINWMLSLLGLASASCYFSHIICLSLMFFSMFWEIFFSF